MKIVEHESPKLGTVQMNCDGAIDPKLENNGEAVKVCFSRPNFTIFSGGMGSGKTSLVLSMLKGALRKTHHEMYVVIPEISLHSIAEKDNIFSKHLDEEHLYHEYTEETLNEIYEKCVKNASENLYSMLIIDDFGGQMKDNKKCELILQKLITKMRHLKLGQIWILCQNYYQMPKKLRELATNVVLWNTNKSQNKKLFQEQFQMPEKHFLELMKVTPTTHDWVLLNLKYKRMFNNNWDEIVFEEEKKTEKK
jgi:archaellum biogenesis ATPase FlaH